MIDDISNNITLINNASELEKIKCIRGNPFLIKYIKNPSDTLKELACTHNGLALAFIDKQYEGLCEIAVSNDGMALQFAHFQNEKICEIALRSAPKSFRFSRIRSQDFVEKAIHLEPTNIIHVAKPTYDNIKSVIGNFPIERKLLKWLDDNEILNLIKLDASIIRCVLDKSDEFIQSATVLNRDCFPYISDNKKFRTSSLQAHGGNLAYINNPTKEDVITAIEQNVEFITLSKYIDIELMVRACSRDITLLERCGTKTIQKYTQHILIWFGTWELFYSITGLRDDEEIKPFIHRLLIEFKRIRLI